MKHILSICIATQVIALAILNFGDIGFDRPGRYGLSYEHGLLCMATFGVALTLGVVVALKRRSWLIATTQVTVPLLILAFFLWPAPNVNALDYQHLVGQRKAVVERELGDRHTVSGLMADDRGEFEFVSYNGFTVYYNTDGIVARIDPDRESSKSR